MTKKTIANVTTLRCTMHSCLKHVYITKCENNQTRPMTSSDPNWSLIFRTEKPNKRQKSGKANRLQFFFCRHFVSFFFHFLSVSLWKKLSRDASVTSSKLSRESLFNIRSKGFILLAAIHEFRKFSSKASNFCSIFEAWVDLISFFKEV